VRRSVEPARGLRENDLNVADDHERQVASWSLYELVSDGKYDEVRECAAAMLTKGLERDLFTVGLTPVERDAVLLSLEEAPTDALGELRGKLMRDHAERHFG
jgi:hypothetical protein